MAVNRICPYCKSKDTYIITCRDNINFIRCRICHHEWEIASSDCNEFDNEMSLLWGNYQKSIEKRKGRKYGN